MGRTAVDWIVQRDPSDTFTARLFTLTTIRQSARDGVWPDGIRFQHQPSRRMMTYVKGELQPVKTGRKRPVQHA